MFILYRKQYAFTLMNGSKDIYIFYFHCKSLPSHQQYKNNIKKFLEGKAERDIAPLVLSSEKLYDLVS